MFHSFLSQITLRISFGSKHMITAFTCPPSYKSLHCGHTFVEGILTVRLSANENSQRTSLSSENKMAAIHLVQIHTHARFPWSKKWPTRHVAVPTGNAQASQQSIFRENCLKFLTFIRRWEGYYRLWHE